MLGLTVRGRAFIALIAVLIGAAAWGSGRLVASVAERNQSQIVYVQQMATAMLGEETALSTLWLTGADLKSSLKSLKTSATQYRSAFRHALDSAGDDRRTRAALKRVDPELRMAKSPSTDDILAVARDADAVLVTYAKLPGDLLKQLKR